MRKMHMKALFPSSFDSKVLLEISHMKLVECLIAHLYGNISCDFNRG